MSRRDNVLAALLALSQERAFIAGSMTRQGFTTEEIAKRAGILRSNCSAELNALVRAGVVTKVQGRPTLYRLRSDKFVVSEMKTHSSSIPWPHDAHWTASPDGDVSPAFVKHSPSRLIDPLLDGGNNAVAFREGTRDEFDWGVGSDESLRDAVQQAKIAVSYPPHGMHVLLLGETGVGKSTFSRRMHQYAVLHGILRRDAPFVAFNCSDYANNPEMLLDQLFGHVRGAYTGAHSDKPGLVEQAHEGMLFLDEVHRLPPQGQEMLFHLLDYGQFRRLGETRAVRHARVLLVAATTEAPESALLSTFRRRIPVVIRLPALRDWTLNDRHKLIYTLCREEARALGRPICISASALDILLFSRFSANIGDLKNTLKLACARAFTSRDTSMIRVFPEHVVVPPSDGPNPIFLRRLSQSADLVVHPDGQELPSSPVLDEGSQFAKLDRLSRTLQELGFATEEILRALERELDKQDQEGQQAPSSIAELRQFVGESFFSAMTRAWNEIDSETLGDADERERAFLRVAMHLFGVIREGRAHSEPVAMGALPDLIERVREDSPELYRLVDRLLTAFTVHSGVSLSQQERAIVAMLMRPREVERRKSVGVVVALFGHAIAREMVDTALRLTGGGSVIAIDVPFQTPIQDMDARLTEAILRAHQGRGVLLLTDVPRFAQGGEWVPPAEVPLGRVHRPDLRTVIRAIQVVENGHMGIEDMVNWLNARQQDVVLMKPNRKRIVWGCCLTGKGTARAVERLIQEALPSDLRGQVEIVPKEIGQSQQTPLVPDDGLVAAVGSVNPGICGVPFFSVETLLTRDGIDQLLNVLYLGDSVVHPERVVEGHSGTSTGTSNHGPTTLQSVPEPTTCPKGDLGTTERMEAHVRSLLQRDLVYVNPALAIQVSKEMWEHIQSSPAYRSRSITPRRETYIRFCLHMAYVIERLVRGEGLVHPYAAMLMKRFPEEWAMMVDAWQPVEAIFRLPVHDHELAYLFEIVFSDAEIEVFE